MKRLVRLSVWPLMAVFELLLLVAGWACAVVHPPTAARIVRFADRLPAPKWYLSNAGIERPMGPQEGRSK